MIPIFGETISKLTFTNEMRNTEVQIAQNASWENISQRFISWD